MKYAFCIPIYNTISGRLLPQFLNLQEWCPDLDGVPLSVTTTTIYGSAGDITGTFYVGRAVQASESGYDFVGKIGFIRFYEKPLSQKQIILNYQSMKSRFPNLS